MPSKPISHSQHCCSLNNAAYVYRWLLQLYRDVMRRLPEFLAAASSVYGGVLKIDSTKKICKKLRGASERTATWVTNVGKNRGGVGISCDCF